MILVHKVGDPFGSSCFFLSASVPVIFSRRDVALCFDKLEDLFLQKPMMTCPEQYLRHVPQ